MDPLENNGQPEFDNSEDGSGEDNVKEFTIDGKAYTEDQIKEYIGGGLRQADYTKKTQELADKRKELERYINFVENNPGGYIKQNVDQLDNNREYENEEVIRFREEASTEMQTLKEELAEMKLDRELIKAKEKYPHMDEEYVLTRLASGVSESVEELAAESESYLEKMHKKYLESKKTDETKTLRGGSGTLPPKSKDVQLPRKKDGSLDWNKARQMAWRSVARD